MASKKSELLITRKEFISNTLKTSIICLSLHRTLFSEISENLVKNYEVYKDEISGAQIIRLITGPSKNSTIYQTHPMWSPDMTRFYFLSNRTSGKMGLHSLNINTREISSVLSPHINEFTLGWKSENIYYIDGNKVSVKPNDKQSSVLADLPDDIESFYGGMGVTPDEKWLYVGFKKKNGKFAIKRLNITNSMWEECCEVDFKIGHIQTNLWDSSKIMFCWETGGDSPQRTWFWSEESKVARPFFTERDELWVTHEVWWGKDSALFTIWPYDEKHYTLPHGVCYTTIDRGVKGDLDVLASYPAWHTHGSHDLKWVLGDDFDRNIWLIEPQKRERRLLVKGKIKNNLKIHPHASFIPDGRGIVFNSSAFGMEEIHLVLIPENFDSLPKVDK